VENVALMREVRNADNIFVANLRETEYLGDIGVYERQFII
jgi:hypothetical protein